RLGRVKFGQQSSRRLAHQDAEVMTGIGDHGLKLRYVSFSECELGFSPRDVEIGRQAGFSSDRSQITRIALRVDIVACHLQLSWIATQLDVPAGDFRDECHQYVTT